MQKVIPAILTADPKELKEKLELFKGESQWMHIDIMDGKFVPNTSVSLFALEDSHEFFNLEIHLMVQNPESYLEDCKEVGAKRVVFHTEAVENTTAFLEKAKQFEFQTAVALNPETATSPFPAALKNVLLMAIHPGFQGQEFLPLVLQKIADTKKVFSGLLLGVDGGVKKENIQSIFQAGADYAVVGSAIMQTQDPVAAFKALEEMVK
ncbi:MAG: ribulose-phosphate 3-epimerase [Candidatus Wildermuthbacteria bacterium]|nr:ribulose-phosphate 3-epimerase [Candidatus Wildermuthbacteria bacterium]